MSNEPFSYELDCYKLLEVDPAADVHAIRASYRRLAEIYHPDAPDTGDAAMFQTITKAWLILCSDESRAGYDESLR